MGADLYLINTTKKVYQEVGRDTIHYPELVYKFLLEASYDDHVLVSKETDDIQIALNGMDPYAPPEYTEFTSSN